MGITLAFVQLLLILFITIDEVKRRSSVAFMWATLTVMFGTMHFLSVLVGNSKFDEIVLTKASLFVISFCVLYIFCRRVTARLYSGIRKEYYFPSLRETSDENTSFLLFVFVFVAISSMWSVARYSGGILNSSWSSGRDYAATLGYANSNQIINILYFSIGGLALYLFIHKEYVRTFVCIFTSLALVLLTRNRIIIIPLFVFFAAIVIFKMKKIKPRYVILAVFGAIAVIYVVYGLLVFRHFGSIQNFIANYSFSDFNQKISNYISSGYGELGLRNDFYYFIENNNSFKGFGKGATYLRMLLVYIPTRYSFGLKPSDFAVTMGAATGGGPGISTHPTLFGDCYANFGWGGILLGVFWAIYAGLADKVTMRFKSQLFRILSYVLNASMYVIIGRGSVYNSFFYIAWGIPFLVVLSCIHSRIPSIRFVFGKQK